MPWWMGFRTRVRFPPGPLDREVTNPAYAMGYAGGALTEVNRNKDSLRCPYFTMGHGSVEFMKY